MRFPTCLLLLCISAAAPAASPTRMHFDISAGPLVDQLQSWSRRLRDHELVNVSSVDRFITLTFNPTHVRFARQPLPRFVGDFEGMDALTLLLRQTPFAVSRHWDHRELQLAHGIDSYGAPFAIVFETPVPAVLDMPPPIHSSYNIPGGPLVEQLYQWSERSDLEFQFDPNDPAMAKPHHSIHGTWETLEALSHVLQGTAFVYERITRDVIVIARRPSKPRQVVHWQGARARACVCTFTNGVKAVPLKGVCTEAGRVMFDSACDGTVNRVLR